MLNNTLETYVIRVYKVKYNTPKCRNNVCGVTVYYDEVSFADYGKKKLNGVGSGICHIVHNCYSNCRGS